MKKWKKKVFAFSDSLFQGCSKCGGLENYQDTGWCEHCLWDLIKDDQALVAVLQQEIHEEDQENASNESD